MLTKTNELTPAGQPSGLSVIAGSALNDDDLRDLWAMYQTVMGGGVAPVNEDDAKRLESLGMVKLSQATEEDYVAGEIEPQYTFTLTKAGEEAAKAYRASWQNR